MSSPPPSPHPGAHIVVADEKPVLLDMMVRTLRGAAHCVFQAYDGQAAYELTLGLRDIDLLITNTRMAGISGPELIRYVRAQRPSLPILYIQNQEQPPQVPSGLPADVPILREPFTAEQLLAAVRPLLQRDGKSSAARTA
jgi:two-component system, cell cycle sensor histidine kinase and response regulator CckA